MSRCLQAVGTCEKCGGGGPVWVEGAPPEGTTRGLCEECDRERRADEWRRWIERVGGRPVRKSPRSRAR